MNNEKRTKSELLDEIKKIQRAEDMLHIQHGLGIALSGVTNLKNALILIVDAAVKITDMDCGGVYLVDTDSKTLNLVYSTGLSTRFVDKISHYERDSEQAKIITKGRPIYIEYSKLEISKDPVKSQEKLHSIAIIPILHRGEAIAALNVASHTVNSISPSSRETLEIIASQVGSAIARVIAEDKIRKQNRELQALSKELQKEINDRKQTHKALRKSEEKYRELVQHTNSIILRFDTQSRITFLNEFAQSFFGYTEDEILNQNVVGTIVPETESSGRNLAIVIKDIIRNPEGYINNENESIRRNGERVWIAWTNKAIFSDDGNVSEILSIGMDITARKHAEEALSESEERFRVLFEQAPDPFYINKMDGAMVNGNKAAEKLLGYQKEELIGKNFLEIGILSEKDLPTALNLLKQNQRGAPTGPHEFTLNRKNGAIVQTEISTFPVNIKGEKLVLGVARDITERKKAEEQKSNLEAQLRQAQKMESIGTLAGGIAHDFNNILFPVIGFTEILLDDLPDDSTLHMPLNKILSGTLRARDLIKQILTFSRQNREEPKPLKIQPIIKEALKLIRSTIPTTIEMKHDIGNECGFIMADPTQIHQIVMNLCTNSYHAMEETGGTLAVNLKEVDLDAGILDDAAATPGPYACLTVDDTGPGIERGIVDRIFDPYFTTKEVGKGTGLGLAVVHGIVKSHGGHINIYSHPFKGTKFKIYLPVIKAQSETAERVTALPVEKGSERVLLVDDQEEIVFMITSMLERLGYQVTPRTSSIEALEAFRANPDVFNVVITDMTMPNMTGDKLAGELMKIRSDIPVILCTGFSEWMSKEKAKVLGIKGFLMKPIVMGDLSSMIRKVLENK
jgi:PAS domain S-box-containing protein